MMTSFLKGSVELDSRVSGSWVCLASFEIKKLKK